MIPPRFWRISIVSLLVGCTVTNPVIVPSEYLLPNERFLSVTAEVVRQDIEACQQKAPRQVEDLPPDGSSVLLPILVGIGLIGLAATLEYGPAHHEQQHPAANGVLLISAASVLVLATVVGAAIYLNTSSKYKKEVASKVQQCLEALGYEVRN
jgi:hypothetical protein